MPTKLNAHAYQELGATLYDSLNSLIEKYETANGREFDENGMNVVLKALWPDGPAPETQNAYDTVQTWLRSLLQKKGIPTSDRAREILAAAEEAKEVNAETRKATNKMTTTETFKRLTIKQDMTLTTLERRQLNAEFGNAYRQAYASLPPDEADAAIAAGVQAGHDELNSI